MRIVLVGLVFALQTILALLAGVGNAAADASGSGKPTIVPIERTRVLLALPERPPQAQPGPGASASQAPGSRGVPIVRPAVSPR